MTLNPDFKGMPLFEFDVEYLRNGIFLFEHLYSPRMVGEIKEGKKMNSKRTNSDVT